MKMNNLIILMVITVLFLLAGCSTMPSDENPPVITNVTKNEVTINWESKDKYKGKVFYKNAGKQERPAMSADILGSSNKHEVMIKGLSPSTHYVYWLGGAENKKYSFQTEADNSASFTFLIADSDSSDDLSSLILSEDCSFILSLKGKSDNTFSSCRSLLPVFYLDKNDNAAGESAVREAIWSFDWGGLRMILVNSQGSVNSYLYAPGSHTIGIILNKDVMSNDKSEICRTEFHRTLVMHNQESPNSPVAFVGVMYFSQDTLRLDDILYFNLSDGSAGHSEKHQGIVMLDIDVESATAYIPALDRELLLKAPPLQGKRTCKGCQRLAEKGAYKESIEAYKAFIDHHQGHFQIDDAYFAIAEILDEKLFQYKDAIDWYNLLIEKYPESSLIPIAKLRISYISEYSDYNYEPLAGFERLKTVDFLKARDKKDEQQQLLEKANNLLNKYPSCKITPVVMLWIASQYQQFDSGKAIRYYQGLKAKFPAFSIENEVAMKIGETYYNSGNFSDAKKAFIQARMELPQSIQAIDAQLNRIKRNNGREILKYVAWLIIALVSLVSVIKKPAGLRRVRIKRTILISVIYTLLLCILSWLIREEFRSYNEMLLILACSVLLMPFSAIVSTTLASKLFPRHNVLAKLIGSIAGILIFIFGYYLIIYYVNVHYLITFKL